MYKKKGFLLLSFLLYLLLYILLTTLCFDWVLASFTTYTLRARRNAVVINAYTAHGLFIRDIHMAPLDVKEWKKISSSEVIWHYNNQDIGWCHKDKKLIRSEGHYNKQSDTWHKKINSIAAQHINTLTFAVTKQLISDRLIIKNITIKCEIKDQGYVHILTNVIALKNRLILCIIPYQALVFY